MTSSVRRDATILHADLDSFYAAVAQRDDPRLRGRPVAVGGGVVLAASYEAKRYGVRTAMSGRQARALCPGLLEVRADFAAYTAASRAVFRVFDDVTPRVQGVSIDEAFLDVGGLPPSAGSPEEIGARLRARVRAEVGLAITVGVARTPFLAKVASRVAKPDGLLRVDPAGEDDFLHPLAVELLWGVGPRTCERLHGYGIRTAGDVAELDRSILCGILGPAAGSHLYAVVHGLTPTALVTHRRRSSIGAQRALGPGPHRWQDLETTALGLVDRVCQRMRAGGRIAATVQLRLRFGDYQRATRSRSLRHPTGSTATVAEAILTLLRADRDLVQRRGITLVGVALTNLASAQSHQPMLPLDPDTAGLDAALDGIRHRFGSQVVIRGSQSRRALGWSVPQLPDAAESDDGGW